MRSVPEVVALAGAAPGDLEQIGRDAADAAGHLDRAVALARRLGGALPGPGRGGTRQHLSVLATLAAADLTVARVVEPHLDALAILAQAGLAPQDGAYGVYAAQRPGLEPVQADDAGRLTGVKPWCSLAARLDRALITAEQGGRHRLFDIDLHDPGATAATGGWVARGLAAVDSGDLALRQVTASPVGEPGWYVRRPGFAWGGIGVAACWFGGAVGVAAEMRSAAGRRPPDQVGLAAIGEVDRLLWAARCALEDAVGRIDAGAADGAAGVLLALRVRGVVADVAERVLTVAGHAMGPAPLTLDETHARRVADLTVYLRQHHAARDDAREGEAVLHADRG